MAVILNEWLFYFLAEDTVRVRVRSTQQSIKQWERLQSLDTSDAIIEKSRRI